MGRYRPCKEETWGQLDGKMAIVTGAGTGIGKGIARAFAREGADLTIASRNRENLETSAEELRSLGAQVLVVQAGPDGRGADTGAVSGRRWRGSDGSTC